MTTGIRSNPIKSQTTDEVVVQLNQMLKEIRFGSIEIIIHDNRIVQIERREKIRPDAAKA
ncbi:MAG: YezD family protein [Methylosarcina sp.]